MPLRRAPQSPACKYHRRSKPEFAYRGGCKWASRLGPNLESRGAVNVWILCNEGAGRSFSAEDVRHLVRRAGHTVVGVAKEYDAETQLADRHIDLVVAAGGDGTVATVAGIALKTGAALAILPLGTANNIATSLGVEGAVSDLIASWTNGRRRSLDLGVARAASKEWLMVEGAGGGLVPAGIATAQAALERQDEPAPIEEVTAAVRCF